MTKKTTKSKTTKSSKTSKSKSNPIKSFLAKVGGVLVIVIGALIYALTGFDFLGINSGDTDVNSPNITSVAPVNPTAGSSTSGTVQMLTFEQGFGAKKGFWEVYFTAPLNTRDRSQYKNGIDAPIATAINATRSTLDIAAFEMNNEVITAAILGAHRRGVRVRIVTDDEHGIEDDDTTLVELELAGIPIVNDARSALMHNKFMIMDNAILWMGSTNYTVNDVYRNNNNMMMLRSQRAVQTYQAEFNEMFERGQFGIRSDASNTANFNQDGTPIEIYYASENNVVGELVAEINAARSEIRFMAFSFTRDDMGDALLARVNQGVNVQGVFENTGSETTSSELRRLLCAGLDVRQDGNSGVMHHKVFIIDRSVVVTGSFNFSDNAVSSNDENLVIIRDADLAALFLQEFGRVQSIAARPTDISC